MLIAGCLLISLAGCGPKARVLLNFTPDDVTTYKISTATIKDFRFEQPSLTPPKLKEEQSGTTIDVTFDQKIEEVQEDGSAVATITIKEVAYLVKEKNEVRFDFDSTREADKGRGFAKVIGQSYKIRIAPDGKVTVVDAKDVAGLNIAGHEGQLAKAFFSEKQICERHQVPALPSGKANRVVTVSMNAQESAEAADPPPDKNAGMGRLANMFDTKETYTGKLVLEMGTGRIRQFEEKLVATYLAAEDPAEGPSDKGPDTLMMGFTFSVSMQLVD
jgi:predicted small lipoprotein YifL